MDVPDFPDVDAVVIGASAGGVDALGSLLAALPAKFKPAVLVVIHLPPDQPSGLASLLGRRCALPVGEALDKQPVQASAVVLAPPNYHLMVEPELTLALSVDAPVLFSRPSIDVLFDSAAHAYGTRILAIVLTGGSADGSEGLASIRQQGGRAWVQDPDTAVARTMPASALARAGADAVLSLEQMALSLSRAGGA